MKKICNLHIAKEKGFLKDEIDELRLMHYSCFSKGNLDFLLVITPTKAKNQTSENDYIQSNENHAVLGLLIYSQFGSTQK